MGAKSSWGTLEGLAASFSPPLLLRIRAIHVFSPRTLCLTWAPQGTDAGLKCSLRRKEKGEMTFTEHLLFAGTLARL